MINENVYLFLNSDSLKTLEWSAGVNVLIRMPIEIDKAKDSLVEIEARFYKAVKRIEEAEKEYNELNDASLSDKVLDKIEIERKIQACRERIRRLKDRAGYLYSDMHEHKSDIEIRQAIIDNFIAELAKVGLEPKDIIDAYNELKLILSDKEKLENKPNINASKNAKSESENQEMQP